MAKVNLIIEKGSGGKLWGRVSFKDNLITDFANSVGVLEKKIKKAIKDFHGAEVEFESSYDVSAFFENFDFLNQSKIAELSGINPGLLRQYASGIKHPSSTQAKKIESAVHRLAKELKSVTLHPA